MKKKQKIDMWMGISLGILLLYIVFMLYPLLKILVQSVLDNEQGTFTMQYFKQFFSDTYYFSTLLNSFKIAVCVTVVTLALGVPLAYLYNMYELKGRNFLQVMIILCSMSAPFIGAYSFCWVVPASSPSFSAGIWGSRCRPSTALTESFWCWPPSCSRWCSCTCPVR